MQTSKTPTRYIKAARAITGDGETVLDDVLIGLADDEIVSVIERGSATVDTADVPVDDYSGCTILPGLIDAHTHLTLSGYEHKPYEQMIGDSDVMMGLVALRNLQRHLFSGVTTLRDNGGRNSITFTVRAAIARGYFESPRLLLSGRPVTHTGGHFHWCNGVADGEVALRAAVRRLVTEGADHIKIMASGGGTAGGLPHYAAFDIAELTAIVETAHSVGRLTTAHCRARESMANAVAAGVDCIEHAEYLVPREGSTLGKGLAGAVEGAAAEFDAELTKRMVDSGTYVSVTLQQGGYDSLRVLRQEAESRALTEHEGLRKERLEARYRNKLDLFRRKLDAGLWGHLAISTDAGVFDTEFGRMHHCLELATEGGMTPLQAISAATLIPARLVGMDNKIGSVEVGKLADLLIVGDDPSVNVSTVADVRGVYSSGRLVTSPTALIPAPLVQQAPVRV